MTTQNKNYTLELELMCQYEDGKDTFIERLYDVSIDNKTLTLPDGKKIIEVFWSVYKRDKKTGLAEIVKDFYNYNSAIEYLKAENKHSVLEEKTPYHICVLDTKINYDISEIHIIVDRYTMITNGSISDCGRYTIVDTKMRKHESSMRIVFTCKFNPSIIHRINHIKTGDIFKTLYI